jgi:mRNA-degrading endonuclease RelE of RelBE toxin-antitoxin system
MTAIRVEFSDRFKREVDALDRKFAGALEEVVEFVGKLKRGERPGDRIPKLGGHIVYKVRLPNPAARRGKRGGFRVIYYVERADRIFLVTIYAKSKRENISSVELRRIIERLSPR